MKKIIFTLLFIAVVHLAYSQTTYYWVGGANGTSFTSNANWNTGVGGTGAARTTAASNDILIFDGYDISSDPGQQTGAITVSFTGTITTGQIILKDNADVTFSRSGSTGTTLVTIAGTGDADPDFVVNAGSKFSLAGTIGSMAVAIGAAATGEVYGDVFFNEGGANQQNRLVALAKNSLKFFPGSTAQTATAYAYNPFGTSGSSTTPAAASGVIFSAGSSFIYRGGLSPFGTASASLVDFQAGSTFVFNAAPTGVSSMWSNRVYPNVMIQNNTTVNPDATFIKMDTLTIQTGSGFLANTSGASPINGNIINNGTFAVPAADPNRGNKLLMINSVPQFISGTGTYNLGYFVISNVSDIRLQRTVTVDSSTIIFGKLAPNGFLAGPGSVVSRTPQTYNTTGNINVDSFVVKNISSFTGLEVGMSVTGTNIQPNTVVIAISSTNGTITLSKPATGSTYASSASNLTVSNGQGVLPIKFGNVAANLQNGQTAVTWKVLTESGIARYEVERSLDGIQFTGIGSVNANGSAQYSWIDINAAGGISYYRIKAISNDGGIILSSALRVNNGNSRTQFSIYPNPVTDRNINLQLSNLSKGNYILSLFNNLGQQVFTRSIKFQAGYSSEVIALPATTKAGLYRLVLTGENTSLKQTLVIE
jgi:hypothetical protein